MKLSDYLKRVGKSPEQFAAENPDIGTGRAVRRYVMGQRFPRPSAIVQIAEATGGKVTERDWYREKFGPLESRVA